MIRVLSKNNPAAGTGLRPKIKLKAWRLTELLRFSKKSQSLLTPSRVIGEHIKKNPLLSKERKKKELRRSEYTSSV